MSTLSGDATVDASKNDKTDTEPADSESLETENNSNTATKDTPSTLEESKDSTTDQPKPNLETSGSKKTTQKSGQSKKGASKVQNKPAMGLWDTLKEVSKFKKEILDFDKTSARIVELEKEVQQLKQKAGSSKDALDTMTSLFASETKKATEASVLSAAQCEKDVASLKKRVEELEAENLQKLSEKDATIDAANEELRKVMDESNEELQRLQAESEKNLLKLEELKRSSKFGVKKLISSKLSDDMQKIQDELELLVKTHFSHELVEIDPDEFETILNSEPVVSKLPASKHVLRILLYSSPPVIKIQTAWIQSLLAEHLCNIFRPLYIAPGAYMDPISLEDACRTLRRENPRFDSALRVLNRKLYDIVSINDVEKIEVTIENDISFALRHIFHFQLLSMTNFRNDLRHLLTMAVNIWRDVQLADVRVLAKMDPCVSNGWKMLGRYGKHEPRGTDFQLRLMLFPMIWIPSDSLGQTAATGPATHRDKAAADVSSSDDDDGNSQTPSGTPQGKIEPGEVLYRGSYLSVAQADVMSSYNDIIDKQVKASTNKRRQFPRSMSVSSQDRGYQQRFYVHQSPPQTPTSSPRGKHGHVGAKIDH